MNILILDVETTTSNKGNSFDQTNKLVCIGVKRVDHNFSVIKYFDEENIISFIQEQVDDADILVGFNIKFDLHWLRRAGIDISNIKVWDCQIAEFLLNNQQTPYPSLNQAAEKYNLEKKLDVVKTEFWDKGINTDEIPREILSSYLEQDLVLTQQVFEKQREIFKDDNRYKLFKLQCMDLLVLEEIEYNGIFFNTEKALTKAKEIENELSSIHNAITSIIGNIPFNLNSNDHVSAILYGGSINIDTRIPVGVYKSGAKEGQTRYKIVTKTYELPRLAEPLKGTETKVKEGEDAKYWLVNETILRKLKLNKKAKEIVDLMNRYSELDKLRGTYLEGYSDLIAKMNWEENMLHGNLNQCVVVTGRLSSTKPNLQNADPQTKTFMESRYE